MLNSMPFSEQEHRLILELLQTERRQLPVEIHHTDSPEVHDQLEKRLDMVDRLIQRMKESGQKMA